MRRKYSTLGDFSLYFVCILAIPHHLMEDDVYSSYFLSKTHGTLYCLSSDDDNVSAINRVILHNGRPFPYHFSDIQTRVLHHLVLTHACQQLLTTHLVSGAIICVLDAGWHTRSPSS